MHVRRRRPHVNFKLETISSQWFSCPSLRMAEQKCRCGPGFFAPQNTDDSPAVTVAAAPGRRAWHDARYRSHPRHRRHRHRIDLRSRRARPRSDFLGYARRFRAVRRHCRVLGADACLAAARPHARHGLSGRDLGGGRLHCRHCASLAPRRAAADRARADRLRRFAAAAGGHRLVLCRREPAELGADSARYRACRSDRAADRAHCAAAACRRVCSPVADRLGGTDVRAFRTWACCSSARKDSAPSR